MPPSCLSRNPHSAPSSPRSCLNCRDDGVTLTLATLVRPMLVLKHLVKVGAAILVCGLAYIPVIPAFADGQFPFGLEMTLDAARQPGSKRIPTLEIGEDGQVILELW